MKQILIYVAICIFAAPFIVMVLAMCLAPVIGRRELAILRVLDDLTAPVTELELVRIGAGKREAIHAILARLEGRGQVASELPSQPEPSSHGVDDRRTYRITGKGRERLREADRGVVGA